VADALGEDFEPWVRPVMEKMLQGARQVVQVKAYDGTFRHRLPSLPLNGCAEDAQEVAVGWDVIDDQYLLNTSALEDRLTHVQQLDQICANLGPRLMQPYLDEVARCCVENLGFKLDEGVRAVSCSSQEWLKC
jgi:hypothetical protein